MKRLLTLGLVVVASPVIITAALLMWVALTMEPIKPLEVEE